ncbi:MAG: hydroxyacid dehydrogenase [Planctomycetota bacterium]|nr:MAG: hydroxyacid dehydrogenase [Planctomycetota bacterium]
MRVLIADKFEASGIDGLRAAGLDVTSQPGIKGDELRHAIVHSECQILVVRGTKVTADMIDASTQLGLIVRAGAGYNTIDVAAASRKGIFVSNCPGKNAVAVAELTFGLILALDRRIVENVVDLRAGRWNKKDYAVARGLKDRTLGIIGMGQIGQAVAERAKAFEMKVVAWSRSFTDEAAEALEITRLGSPAEVAASCDICTVHVAAAPETKGFINADVLERLRPGSYFINTARADVMDYAALAKVVREKGIRVGLDVFPGEPETATAEYQAEILKAGGVIYGTHHIGASTDQAQEAIAAETVRICAAFKETGQVPNCVNIETKSPACCQLVVRHFDRVGVLAAVLDMLRRAEINVEEMSNTIFQGAKAAVAVIRLHQRPQPELLKSIADMKDMIISVELKPL